MYIRTKSQNSNGNFFSGSQRTLLHDVLIGLHRKCHRAHQGHAGGPEQAVTEIDQDLGSRLAPEDITAKLAAEPRGVASWGRYRRPERRAESFRWGSAQSGNCTPGART